MISGINHITLAVADLDKSFDFYKNVLGFKPLAHWSKGAYFLAGDLWFCLIQDKTKTRKGPLDEYSHIAFTVSVSDFESVTERIKSSGTKIWQENASEGASLYFLDPSGHKLEIHASDWRTRIEAAKHDPWDDKMEFFV